jgi:hypothetical protein
LKYRYFESIEETDVNVKDVQRKPGVLFGLLFAVNPEMTAEHTNLARIDIINGNDRSNWKAGISTSAAVQYKGLYKNIDLKVYGIRKQMEYDWKVRPGGDPNQIAFRYDNVKNTRIDTTGSGEDSLIFSTLLGGDSDDHLHKLRMDAAENIYLMGDLSYEGFPLVEEAMGYQGGEIR